MVVTTNPQWKLICLLPVRNGADILPQYFDSVRTFCSGVIALDDGSIDDTRSLLTAEPIVKALLTNQPRTSYHGWNDSKNRQRLLDACEDFTPQWVIWVDADEVIPAYDVPLLKQFIDAEAKPEELELLADAEVLGHLPGRGPATSAGFRTIASSALRLTPVKAAVNEPR
jgi:glycosyltransferase involved in cell wall biosynthesis